MVPTGQIKALTAYANGQYKLEILTGLVDVVRTGISPFSQKSMVVSIG